MFQVIQHLGLDCKKFYFCHLDIWIGNIKLLVFTLS